MSHGYAADVVAEGARILAQNPVNVSVGVIKDEFLSFLKAKQICYEAIFHSDQVLVHPKNRGGLLINPFNANRNGSAICRSGANLKELHGAVAFELQVDPQLKQAVHTGSIQ